MPETRDQRRHVIRVAVEVYGRMDVSDARPLKALDAKNVKLKKMLAEQILNVATLKEMLGKNL